MKHDEYLKIRRRLLKEADRNVKDKTEEIYDNMSCEIGALVGNFARDSSGVSVGDVITGDVHWEITTIQVDRIHIGTVKDGEECSFEGPVVAPRDTIYHKVGERVWIDQSNVIKCVKARGNKK